MRNWLKSHLVDSTALLAESTPVFASFETYLAGMSDFVSMKARLIVAGVTYGGFGTAYKKGRNFSRKIFNIKYTDSERIQGIHDALYLAAINSIAAPIIYTVSGSRDLKEIAIGTLIGIGLGLINGAPIGYAVDVFEDLTGLKNCERPSYPNFLKKQNSKTKKGLAALLVAGSVGLTAGIYALTPK